SARAERPRAPLASAGRWPDPRREGSRSPPARAPAWSGRADPRRCFRAGAARPLPGRAPSRRGRRGARRGRRRRGSRAVTRGFPAPGRGVSVNRMRRLAVVPALLAVLLTPAVAAEPRASVWDLHYAAERAGVPSDAKLAMRGAHGQTRSVLQMPLGSEISFDV